MFVESGFCMTNLPVKTTQRTLCLWELWHSVIRMLCSADNGSHDSHKHKQSHMTSSTGKVATAES